MLLKKDILPITVRKQKLTHFKGGLGLNYELWIMSYE